MGEKALISVIIPAYNAERTLERTVRSVLGQTLKEIEVWIVDDGSKDRTGEIADRLAVNDIRVHVIHQTNQRAYAARINALKPITTSYFAFVDADDTLEPQMYERMYALAVEHNLDVVQCEQFGRGSSKGPDIYLSRDEVREKYVIPYLIEGRSACFVWDKLYKRHLADREFESSNILMFDDLKINFQVFERVERMGILHEGLYHYDVNPGSSVSNFKRRNIDDFREIINTRARWAAAYGVAADDVRLNCWIVKNARNFLISACAARAESFKVRLENVQAILNVLELKQAMPKCLLDKMRDRNARFLWCFQLFPLIVSVSLVRGAKTIWNRMKS